MSREEFLWVEKYRPQTISDCILPTRIKDVFKQFVAGGRLPQNLLLTGGAGIGKTTIARALCSEIGADVLFINASIEGNIDTLRNKIKQFASSISMMGNEKVVILDEADYSNAQSFQPALRAFMEEFSSNCKFILTCNFKNKLIEPIHSRCAVIEFVFTPDEKMKMQAGFWARLRHILEEEGVTYDEKVLAEFVKKFYPDFRRAINELQRYSTSGSIDTGLLATIGDVSIDELMRFLKAKKYSDMRKWVAQNSDLDPATIFRKIYDGAYEYLKPSSIPQADLILNDAQYKAAFVADAEINTVAACVEIMMNCDFE